jgi:hypothetical protein
LPDLLDQIDGPVERFIADGALMDRQPAVFWPHALARSSRSSSHLPRRRSPVH